MKNEQAIQELRLHLEHWERLTEEHIAQKEEAERTVDALLMAINALSKPNGDLISRADAIACLSHGEGCGHSCRNKINALPSAEPKTGKWVMIIDEETPNLTKWHYECDQCGAGRWEEGQRYCQNCGARMIREDGEA